jgi:predicted acylesterase/phospholipase RssA
MESKSESKVLALAGGGPVTGLHIGALERLRDVGELKTFNVWSLSCIGAWVGIIYLQADPGREIEQTRAFFHDKVFREDESYKRFPINTVFGPDLLSNQRALLQFLADPESYCHLVLPKQYVAAARDMLRFLMDPRKWWDLRAWTDGELNQRMLDLLSAHPASRFLTSMLYLSSINGLSRIYYPGSPFLASIRFDRLNEFGKPLVYHNAWNLSRQKLELFTNRPVPGRNYRRITDKSLCACSALPYIEATVEIDGDTYCEGALVDTVNFHDLVRDLPDLEEVWVSRLVDTSQIRPPRNLTEALGNLCMLFAAETGKNDIKLFKYHLDEESLCDKKEIRVVELPVSARVNFDWSRANLARGIEEGREAVDIARSHVKQLDDVRKRANEDLHTFVKTQEAHIRDAEAELLLQLAGSMDDRIRVLRLAVAKAQGRSRAVTRHSIRAELLDMAEKRYAAIA